MIIATTAIQAPWVTFVANTTTSTIAVNMAPVALIACERQRATFGTPETGLHRAASDAGGVFGAVRAA